MNLYIHLRICILICTLVYMYASYVCVHLCVCVHTCWLVVYLHACVQWHTLHESPTNLQVDSLKLPPFSWLLPHFPPTRLSRIAHLCGRLCRECHREPCSIVGLRSIPVPNKLSALAWGCLLPCCSLLGFSTLETKLRAVLFCVSGCPLSQRGPFIFN